MSRMPNATEPPIASQRDQLAWFVETSGRHHGVPIRPNFLQQGKGRDTVAGPLASLVTSRDERALDLYLLALLVIAKEPYTSTRDARIWARALGISSPKNTGAAAVSKAWSRLEARRLITKARSGRLACVELLKEDGSGDPYLPPGEQGDRYFRLPVDYWTEGFINTLRLPGKAMLLIALSLKSGFTLPSTKAKDWYGISSDTLERGFGELRTAGVLRTARRSRIAPEAPEGYVIENHYRLLEPFARKQKKTP